MSREQSSRKLASPRRNGLFSLIVCCRSAIDRDFEYSKRCQSIPDLNLFVILCPENYSRGEKKRRE